ncbi:ABC transporter permease [Lachnospiraceae bacterium C1.1]|nr:ABC transporter permease [Lachnospiraceae bacterium C1.1]
MSSIIITSFELGAIYALVALALFISFSILNIADLSTDGCFTLGCAVGALVTIAGHPFLALPAAMAAGVISGFITAFLQTKLGVQSILAGIIVNTGLYTINFLVMGRKSNLNIVKKDTVFSLFDGISEAEWFHSGSKLILMAILVILLCLILNWFLNTTLGLSIRATGDNENMVKASSINPVFTIIVGLCVSGSLTGLAGALIAQYQKSADINFGTGQVTIALASLMIGQTLIRKGGIFVKTFGVVLGSCLYRLIVAIALRFDLPAEALKLTSAIIVTIAISAPYVKSRIAVHKRQLEVRKNA